MQVNNTPTLTPVPSRFPWFLSLMLLVLVVVLSTGLGVYNMFYLDRNIEKNNAEIATTEEQIRLASTDRRIIITQILKSNSIRPSLDITGLIREFQKAAIASNVRLKGFSVANDVISTTLIATEGDPQIHPDPASTVIKMMRDYASTQRYFALEPIYALSGTEKERTTAIQFKVIGKQY